MRTFLSATAAVFGLIAAPAFAQSNSSSSSQSSPDAMQIEQSLKQDLTKAGFTDISITPGSFLVHAKNSKGQSTEMMISPSTVTQITAVGNSSGSGQSSSNSTPKK